jgi:hypothetical protein
VTDGVIPPWSNLPYNLLCDIMAYASYPLFDDRNNPTPNILWLLKTASVCKTFLEPSLAALYRCPPLPRPDKPHLILSALSQPQTSRLINYNVKVKRLELEAYTALTYVASGYGPFDLGLLIQQLPLLTEVDIWRILDSPKHRHLEQSAKQWSYPESMFDALIAGGNKLKSFHWNSRLMGKVADVTAMYPWMHQVHATAPFQTLRQLTLTKFLGDSRGRVDLFEPTLTPAKPPTTTQINLEAAREEKRQAIKREDALLAQAVCSLPNLTMLDLHQCSVVDGEWLALLPSSLTSLGISECDRIDSDGLQAFLLSHGNHLKDLVLNHNPSLSISFLSTLKATCPHLETFNMDLTYYSNSLATGVREPEYENLLLPDERPTWPSTLRTIQMLHLRRWTGSAAESFFGSLIDSADSLPDLRFLELVVSLSISWRDRATFRDQWIDRIDRVFKRKSTPPNPHWMSLRGFREWKSRRIVSHVEIPVLPTPQPSDAGEKRHLRPRKSVSDMEEQTDASPSENLRNMVLHTLEKHVQGKCDVVDIRIDNLRPREGQWHESDFLDSEVSGDEDYDEARGDLDEDEIFIRKGRKKKKSRMTDYAW